MWPPCRRLSRLSADMPAHIRLDPALSVVVLERDGELPEAATPTALSRPSYLTVSLLIGCARYAGWRSANCNQMIGTRPPWKNNWLGASKAALR
jgi:hypothetical protein